MRAQQAPVGKVKSIVHRPRRVILRDIQRLEIMEVVLDLRPRGYLESGLREDALDAQPRPGDGMNAAGFLAAPRQGHIDGAPGEVLLEPSLLEADSMHFQGCLDRRLRIVDALARRGTLGRREPSQALELLGEQPLLTQEAHAHVVQGGKTRRLT